MAAKLIIVRGLPGSGKSTFAKKLIAAGLADVHVEADMYFMQGDRYVFDKSKLFDAHRWCIEQVNSNLKKGLTVVVSNTFTRFREIKPYLGLTSDVEIFTMEGDFGSIHDVPEETMHSMRSRFRTHEQIMEALFR